MLLRGPFAELMVIVNPSLYHQYITYDYKGHELLYVNMNNPLYGPLKSAL